MSEDQKAEIRKKADNLDVYTFYEEGTYVDRIDTVDNWCIARITSVNREHDTFDLTFDGWSDKYDQRVCPLTSGREVH